MDYVLICGLPSSQPFVKNDICAAAGLFMLCIPIALKCCAMPEGLQSENCTAAANEVLDGGFWPFA